MRNESKEPSDDVKEALEALLRERVLEDDVKAIEIQDPKGLLDDVHPSKKAQTR